MGMIPCLVLACGNSLREDDGVGPWLAEWAAERFAGEARLRLICRQQWTPELVEEIARAAAVIFVDSAVAMNCESELSLQPTVATDSSQTLTHHFDAPALLACARDYYDARPEQALLLTVRAHSMELREGLGEAVQAVLPAACTLLEETIAGVLARECYEPVKASTSAFHSASSDSR